MTRVLVETSDGETSWETVGVHANIIEASWEALLDAVTYGLLRHRGAVTELERQPVQPPTPRRADDRPPGDRRDDGHREHG